MVLMSLVAPIQSKLLNEAARCALKPLGLFQKGRSRTWLDDRGWWLGVVEFQPSSWSEGSYLNVGCMWLWNVKDHISFDEGFRVSPFSLFTDEKQFRSAAEQLAQHAAHEVDRYRSLFPDLAAVANYYHRHPPESFWPNFNAAVVCALAGQQDDAQRFFRRVVEPKDDDRNWVLTAQADAEHLRLLAPFTERFRKTIAERILQTREHLRLPPVSHITFEHSLGV
jgi:hypothetical protein